MLGKLFATIATIAFVATATAGEKKTEFFWKAGADQKAATATLNSYSAKLDPGTQTYSGMPIGLKYNHGLSADWGMSAGTSFGTIETDPGGGGTKTKESGMSDLAFTFDGSNDQGSFTMFMGAGFDLSLGKHKVAADGNSTDRGAGGHALSPYVGILYPATSEVGLGAKFTYKLQMERTTTTASVLGDVETKKTGADAWTLPLFVEYNFGGGFVGLYYAMGAVGESTSKVATVETKSKALTMSGIGLWASYDFGSEFTGLLNYDMATYSQDNAGTTTKLIPTNIAVAGRYNF